MARSMDCRLIHARQPALITLSAMIDLALPDGSPVAAARRHPSFTRLLSFLPSRGGFPLFTLLLRTYILPFPSPFLTQQGMGLGSVGTAFFFSMEAYTADSQQQHKSSHHEMFLENALQTAGCREVVIGRSSCPALVPHCICHRLQLQGARGPKRLRIPVGQARILFVDCRIEGLHHSATKTRERGIALCIPQVHT